MDKLVPILYKNYGLYVNSFRQFPLEIDGLKPVERRVLLSVYEIAREKLVKCARIDGHVMGHYHPHATSYGTLVQLANRGFLDKQGNFGTNVGQEADPPAAMRYTECKLSKRTYEMAFKLIGNVPYVESELDNEPPFLPTMFPFCLIGNDNVVGIGFGYRTFIPCYKIEDLYKRLSFLLNKTKDKPIIRPLTDCEILSQDSEFETLLTTGKATINLKGKYILDPMRCKVTLKSWPPGKRFETILSKFENELKNQDIGYNDESTTETTIVFEVIKQRNRDEIFKKFVKKLDSVLVGNITYETVVVDINKKVKNISIDEMLLNTYKMYTEINKVYLNTEVAKVKSIITEYKLLQKLRPILAKHLKPTINEDDIIKIADEAKVELNIVKELFSKYRIMKLLSLRTETTELENKVIGLENNIKNLSQFVNSQYDLFLKGK